MTVWGGFGAWNFDLRSLGVWSNPPCYYLLNIQPSSLRVGCGFSQVTDSPFKLTVLCLWINDMQPSSVIITWLQFLLFIHVDDCIFKTHVNERNDWQLRCLLIRSAYWLISRYVQSLRNKLKPWWFPSKSQANYFNCLWSVGEYQGFLLSRVNVRTPSVVIKSLRHWERLPGSTCQSHYLPPCPARTLWHTFEQLGQIIGNLPRPSPLSRPLITSGVRCSLPVSQLGAGHGGMKDEAAIEMERMDCQ